MGMGSAGQSGMGGKGGAQMPQAPQQGMGAKGGGNPMPQKPPMGGMNPKGGSMPQKPPMMPQQGMNGKGGQLNPTTTFPGPGGQQQGGMMGGSLQGSPYELYAQQLQGTPAGQPPMDGQGGMGGKGKGGGMAQGPGGVSPPPMNISGAMYGMGGGQMDPRLAGTDAGRYAPGSLPGQQQDFAKMNPQIAEQMRQQQMGQMAQKYAAMARANPNINPAEITDLQGMQPGGPAYMQRVAELQQKGVTGLPGQMPPPGMLPQNPGQMPPAPTAQRVAQPNSRQAAQRALQQFRPGMFRGMM